MSVLGPIPVALFANTDAAWLHDLSPFLWRISGDFGLRWYGLSYIAGFALGYVLLRFLAKRGATPLPAERVFDAIVLLALSAVIGGRVGYAILYQPSLLWGFSGDFPFWSMLALTQGGMSSHGGMLGVLCACWRLTRGFAFEDGSRSPKMPLLHTMDLAALLAPPGLLLGRLANFVNGELLGKPVAAPGEPGPWWSVRFPQEVVSDHAPELTAEQLERLMLLVDRVAPGVPFGDGYKRLMERVQAGNAELAAELAPLLSARHPSQLYQAAVEGLVVGGLVWLVACKPRRPGVISAAFLMSYGVLRILTEVYRLPDGHLAVERIAGLSRGQWYSVVMILAGVLVLLWIRAKPSEPMGGWAR